MGTTQDSDFVSKFSGLSDKEWLNLLISSCENTKIGEIDFPGFPSQEIQEQFGGSSFEHTLREAFRFYVEVKSYALKIGNKLAPSKTILDFGCGWGRITRFFLKDIYATNIHAIDVDPLIVEVTKQIIPGINVEPCNPSPPLNYENNSMDYVIAYSVFSHLAENVQIEWIREFSRILKPNGLLVVTTHSRNFLDFCKSLIGQEHESNWHKALATAFEDIESVKKQYDEGNFIFSPTGGGGNRTPDFYGEAVIPRQYVESHWTEFLKFHDFIDNSNRLPQALIVMQKN